MQETALARASTGRLQNHMCPPTNRSFLCRIRWGVCAAIAMVMLSLLPQIHFWIRRGGEWNGAYVTAQGDEFLYSAYLNALIDGRPRRNDPFSGRDDTPQAPLPETTFSIQFVPAYVISTLARMIGASASAAFIVLIAAAGLLASLSIFWLLASVTENNRLAAVGVIGVLCCGALAAGEGLVGVLLNHPRSFFLPFLRRYQPAAAFPLFFLFCALVWHALNEQRRSRIRMLAALAGLTLSVLIFSYLYLWTAGAAWLACLACLWIYLRPKNERGSALEVFTIAGAIALCSLVPYAYLISNRAANLDSTQTLVRTHRPDLLRTPEVVGVLILISIAVLLRNGRIRLHEPAIIFAAAFALVPFVVFNQQILSGRSMQPYHFESFILNYVVLISLVILAQKIWPRIPGRALAWIAALCILWGAVETGLPALVHFKADVINDQMVPVLRRLNDLSKHDDALVRDRDESKRPTLVFSPHPEVMGLLPTWAPQGTLLGMGTLDFGSATQQERRELLYSYLYFCGTDADRFRGFLSENSDNSFMNFYAPNVIFGHERILPMLSFRLQPIQQHEIDEAVGRYRDFVETFSADKASEHRFSYVVIRVDPAPDLSRLDRWYQRDGGEEKEGYKLYRVTPRF